MKLVITKPALRDLAKLDKTTQKQISLVLDKYLAGEQVDKVNKYIVYVQGTTELL